MKPALELQMKRDFIINRLKNLNISHSRNHVPIENLSYEELKFELVLAELRQEK